MTVSRSKFLYSNIRGLRECPTMGVEGCSRYKVESIDRSLPIVNALRQNSDVMNPDNLFVVQILIILSQINQYWFVEPVYL
jgi:hypothetical protein